MQTSLLDMQCAMLPYQVWPVDANKTTNNNSFIGLYWYNQKKKIVENGPKTRKWNLQLEIIKPKCGGY